MDNILSLLGLMYKANKFLFGDSVLENITKVKYLFIASDASSKTKERYLKKCYYYNIEYNDIFKTVELSKALGKKNIKIVGLTDEGFKKALKNKIKEEANGKTDI